MLTKNWYYQLKTYHSNIVIQSVLRDTSGSIRNSGYYSNYTSGTMFYPSNSFTTGTTSAGIVIGSGTTPATINDYKLESQITSNISVSVVKNSDDNYNRSLTLTVSNLNNSPLTIGEIGTVCNAYIGAESGSCACLMDRTVLDEPITIPANGVGKVTYTTGFEIPVA
jgi:hypothetical protein